MSNISIFVFLGFYDKIIIMSVLWITGLPCAGKTTLGKSVLSKLNKYEKVILLDGDELRKGLNSDLGYSIEDRNENIRRVAHTAKIFSDSGFLVITTLISPTFCCRKLAREIIGENFYEIFVKSSVENCITRDVKGFYKKAICGEIKEFTGISSVYEEPINPQLIVDTENRNIEESTNEILNFLINNEIVKSTFEIIDTQIKVGVVVTRDDGSVLLIKEATKKHPDPLWNILKGTYEGGETILDAAKRECREEASIDVELVGLLGIFISNDHGKIRAQFNFLAQARDTLATIANLHDQKALGETIEEVRWFTREEIARMEQSEFLSVRAYELLRVWLSDDKILPLESIKDVSM